MARTRAPKRGVFITFEGVEGSGKTTQCTALAKRLRDTGYRVVETREPGGTPLAERIRDTLLSTADTGGSGEPVAPICEAFLILAVRSQHVTQIVRPALHDGAVVICDRFTDSTLAYQGYGRGLNLRTLLALNRLTTGGLNPDLTLLFDVPVAIGLARRRKESDQNRLDLETRRFHEQVRRGFLALARRAPRRIRILDGRKEPVGLAADVAGMVLRFLEKRRT